MLCGGLDGKAGAQTSRVVSDGSAVTSVSTDVAERVAAAVISRPQPPPHRRGHGGMIIGHSTITSFVVVVLLLTVLLILVGPIPGSKNLKLGQQEQIICGRCHIAGTVAATASIIRVLSHSLHHGKQIGRQRCHQTVLQRAGRGIAVAQKGFPHVRSIPTATVGVTGIHVEHCRAAGAIVLAVAKSNGLPADFANLEVDAVASLFTGVVVEAQDENIDIEVGERIGSDLAIKSDSLGVAYRPIVCTLPGIADGLDDCPTVAAERFGHQRNGHRERLAGRCSIVGVCTHTDRNSGTAGRLCRHRNGGAGNAHRCNVRIVRGCSHRTAARPCDSDGARCLRVGQAQAACGQRNTASRLSDRPRSAFGRSRPIRPLIVGSRGKGGAVAASVGCAARAADRQLRTVIVAPSLSISFSMGRFSPVVSLPLSPMERGEFAACSVCLRFLAAQSVSLPIISE